jgi:hypothetical protein
MEVLQDAEEPQDFVDSLVLLAHDHLSGKRKRYWSKLEPILFEFLEMSCNQHWSATTHEVDSFGFELEEIADSLSPISDKRYSELQEGATPTAKELDRAKRRYCENRICYDTREATDYFCFQGSDGRKVYFSAGRTYDGSFENLEGPYSELSLPKEGWSGECLEPVRKSISHIRQLIER